MRSPGSEKGLGETSTKNSSKILTMLWSKYLTFFFSLKEVVELNRILI